MRRPRLVCVGLPALDASIGYEYVPSSGGPHSCHGFGGTNASGLAGATSGTS